MSEIAWQDITVSSCETFHLLKGEPLYIQRYSHVMKYHEPGLAPVKNGNNAFHIDTQGIPAYLNQFIETFGFYEGLAAVKNEEGWFHITSKGKELYSARYDWCGNFQEGFCSVKNKTTGLYFHINREGQEAYQQQYHYIGDFKEGSAVVCNELALHTHIDYQGNFTHGKWFLDLDVFHKGFARAKNEKGWFHINKSAKPLYRERYLMIEPFYNGKARVETKYKELLVIDTNGDKVDTLRAPLETPFQVLSGEIVSYWKTQTIKAAVDLDIFEYLPSTLDNLAQKINIAQINIERLLRALQELNLVQKENDIFYHTELSQYLKKEHDLSLNEAVKHWANAHYVAWMHLAQAIAGKKNIYATIYNSPLFEWLDKDQYRLLQYQNAMNSYARHDYPNLVKHVDFTNDTDVLDAGGGQGSLLCCILENNKHLKGVLLERESVVRSVTILQSLADRMRVVSFDLFKPWNQRASTVILSRVLHDWDDGECLNILYQAVKVLPINGRLLIIERLLDETSNCGMLDLNMLVITGGKERNLDQYITLCKKAHLTFSGLKTDGHYNILFFNKGII